MKYILNIINRFSFKLFTLLLLTFGIPSIVMLNKLYEISLDLSFHEAGNNFISNLKSVGDNFDELLRNVDFIHTQVITDEEFLDLNRYMDTHTSTSYSYHKQRASLLIKLNQYYISNNYIDTLLLYNTKSEELFTYSISGLNNQVVSNDTPLLDSFFYTVESSEKRNWELLERADLESTFFTSTSIPNMFLSDEPPTYFSIYVNTALIKKRLSNTFSNHNAGLYLLSNNNCSTNIKSPEFLSLTEKQLTRALDHKNTNFHHLESNNGYLLSTIDETTYLIAYYTTSFTNTTYLCYAPFDKIVKNPSIISQFRNLFIITLCILFLFVSFVLTYYIISPINTLHKSLKKVGDGNLDIRLPVRTKDEFGQIQENFNYMLDRLNTLIEQNYKSEIEKKETKLKYIHTQINEHFLYNTLDSIHWIAKTHNVPEISDIIFSLSKFFRIVLSEGEDMITIPLVNENFLLYIDLINIRLDTPIQLNSYIEPGLENELVLKYLFHPLLENAIIHGLSNIETEKFVNISFLQDAYNILFTIEDNGVGIEAQKLDAILNSFGKVLTEESTNKYFALNNIYKQLKLFYGDTATIKIQSQPMQGTTITLQIPKKDFMPVSK